MSDFITLHTYQTALHPETKKQMHQKRTVNINHLVAVEEKFFADRDKQLKTVCGAVIKMFGQEPYPIKETVAEVEEKIKSAKAKEGLCTTC